MRILRRLNDWGCYGVSDIGASGLNVAVNARRERSCAGERTDKQATRSMGIELGDALPKLTSCCCGGGDKSELPARARSSSFQASLRLLARRVVRATGGTWTKAARRGARLRGRPHASRDSCTNTARHRARARSGHALGGQQRTNAALSPAMTTPQARRARSNSAAAIARKHRGGAPPHSARAFRYAKSFPAAQARTSATRAVCAY